MTNCNKALKTGINDLSARFWLCGGLPRYVLNNNMTYEDLKRNIDEALLSGVGHLKYVLEAAFSQTGNPEEISDRMLHFKYRDALDDNVDKKIIVFASEYVANEVYNQYKIQGIHAVQDFFD